ncbi:MAG: pseudouridine synthase [Paracoccaceae bacterium]
MSDENSKGERIAKAMARAGVASRRDAEKMILDGRVAVNGTKVASPALDVLPSDKITLDGKPIDAPQPARLWLYYKPVGLVTSAKDEKGRQTVFDTMPEGMPRVMSVGRLDLTSEGLLLLTNDGELKRKLELPTTGWLRKYRVRVNGRPNDATFDPLRRGVTIEGEDFQPMEITLDKQQGANAWLTVGLREGKNREIRRAMAEVGLTVNRLIRVSYGPFRLNTMKPGHVVEVKQRVLRDQLGRDPAETASEAGQRDRGGPARKGPRSPRPDAGRDAKAAPRRSEAPQDRKPRAGSRAFEKGREGAGDRSEAGRRPDRPPRTKAADAPGFRHGTDGRPERKPRTKGAPDRDRNAGRNDARPSARSDGPRPARPAGASKSGAFASREGRAAGPARDGEKPARQGSRNYGSAGRATEGGDNRRSGTTSDRPRFAKDRKAGEGDKSASKGGDRRGRPDQDRRGSAQDHDRNRRDGDPKKKPFSGPPRRDPKDGPASPRKPKGKK